MGLAGASGTESALDVGEARRAGARIARGKARELRCGSCLVRSMRATLSRVTNDAANRAGGSARPNAGASGAGGAFYVGAARANRAIGRRRTAARFTGSGPHEHPGRVACCCSLVP
jgi:hypothetical protein